MFYLLGACKTSDVKVSNDDGKFNDDYKFIVTEEYSRDSEFLNTLLSNHDSIELEFIASVKYSYTNIIAEGNSSIVIHGNNASIELRNDTESESLFTFNDINSLLVKDVNLDGNYEQSFCKNYLVRVYSAFNMNDQIEFSNVNFSNASNGGVLFKKQYPSKQIRNRSIGYNQLIVNSCNFYNTGSKGACNIRGSHKDVKFINCTATDPLGRNDLAHIFDFTSEVTFEEDFIDNLLIRDCAVDYARYEGIFIQGVRNVVLNGFTANHVGLDSLGNKYVSNAIKIDDLGRNSAARLVNVKVFNSSDKAYASISIEESKGKSVTKGVLIDSIDVDLLVKLGASGGHTISNSIARNAPFHLLSPNNLITNCKFVNSIKQKSIYIHSDNNEIRNCQFKNGVIDIGRRSQLNRIVDCKLTSSLEMHHFVGLSQNDPSRPYSLSIEKCDVPSDVIGVWAGGYADKLQNINLRLDSNSKTFSVHKDLKKAAKLRN